ncbi:hypothetical protein SAMN05216419_10822 [Nitrosomonas cryotolerans]|uniref:Uncharacterized protein n=1 Tax=Nitrosomonas cryotolerans ATCC 49181 TaxID=1131553 RepID=A0A1N6G090_9PROT|nr:hypothetical protein [Nitrosomonas cryotolerans]SFQ16218.1 hypothetical protein SAMN05216419_10822 [Nitrosomonas cryotolerans]SIO00907.1 hypothetical protein SAMN02743940_0486 [Nitrosomonas cryotolerans ATCC 49181]
MKFAWCMIVLEVMLSACDDSDGANTTALGNQEVSAQSLCVSNSCGERVELFRVPEAENSLLTMNNRMFISGDFLYELTRDAEAEYRLDVVGGDGSNFFNGLAEYQNYLYVIHAGQIFVSSLDGFIDLQPAFTLEGMILPNGMTATPDGHLYITDGPISVTPQIVRLTIDPANPTRILSQEVWLAEGLFGPNGIDYKRLNGIDTLFISDDGNRSIFRLSIQPDGTPGQLDTLHTRSTFFDDLTIVGDHLLVTDYYLGTVFLLSPQGEVLQETDILTFQGTSSVQVGRGGQFPEGHLFVTERGQQFDTLTPFGNALSVFRPQTTNCHGIQCWFLPLDIFRLKHQKSDNTLIFRTN